MLKLHESTDFVEPEAETDRNSFRSLQAFARLSSCPWICRQKVAAARLSEEAWDPLGSYLDGLGLISAALRRQP